MFSENSKVKCPICGEWSSEYLFSNNKYNPFADTHFTHYSCTSSINHNLYSIMKCTNCDIAFQTQKPDEKELSQLYGNVVDNLYLQEEKGRYKTFNNAVKNLNKLCPEKGKLLEIGSYTGIFLEIAKNNQWHAEGVELSSWARNIAASRNISLYSSLDDSILNKVNHFDSIIMWDVIEHLTHPQDILKKAHKLLKPGGILGVSTIIIDSISASVLKKYYPFYLDMHLIYFTKRSLINILKNTGFEIIEFKRHKRYVSISYILSKFSILKNINKITFLRKILSNIHFFCSFGVRDIYARKI